jgi:hypothetical protein
MPEVTLPEVIVKLVGINPDAILPLWTTPLPKIHPPLFIDPDARFAIAAPELR